MLRSVSRKRWLLKSHFEKTLILDIQGVATLNIITGSVACVVRNGDIICHIDELTQDSFMEVETGNVIIHIPAQSSRTFR